MTSPLPQPDRRFIYRPGTFWNDTEGKRIEAHGGCLLRQGESYYWFGEDHAKGHGNTAGVRVYASKDLARWENRGLALPKEALPEAYRDTGACERPKVLHCPTTGKWVMWVHLAADNHVQAEAGVAVADQVEGPYTLVSIGRPIRYAYPGMPLKQWPEEPDDRIAAIDEAGKGCTFRDFTLFQDSDGTAYVYYASENNFTLYIARLRPDYLGIEEPARLGTTWARAFEGRKREAPAVFKVGKRYYMVNSGCSGWHPNPVHWADAPHPLGPWKLRRSIFAPPHEADGWRSQPAYVLPLPELGSDVYLYVGDRWNATDGADSRIIWLPLRVREGQPVRMDVSEAWDWEGRLSYHYTR